MFCQAFGQHKSAFPLAFEQSWNQKKKKKKKKKMFVKKKKNYYGPELLWNNVLCSGSSVIRLVSRKVMRKSVDVYQARMLPYFFK